MIDGMVKAEATAQDIPRPAKKGAIKKPREAVARIVHRKKLFGIYYHG